MRLPRKVLLVDHDPEVTRVIATALGASGAYTIRAEHDDRRALHALRWFQPDVVLLDSSAAHTAALTRALQADPFLQHAPIICLSGLLGNTGFLSSGVLDGFSFNVTPVALDEVVRAVHDLCAG